MAMLPRIASHSDITTYAEAFSALLANVTRFQRRRDVRATRASCGSSAASQASIFARGRCPKTACGDASQDVLIYPPMLLSHARNARHVRAKCEA
jgi:hypothetical protein